MGGVVAESQTFYLCALLVAMAGLGAVGAIHGLGYWEVGEEWNLFSHDLALNWEAVDLGIVVPEWMFYVWMVMYGLQVIWVFYGFIVLARQTNKGWLAAMFPSSIYVFFLFGLASTIAWVVLWDMRDHVTYSIIAAGGATVFYTVALGISVYSLKKYSHQLRHQGHGCDVTFIQLFLHNGVGALTAWMACVTSYVMAVILTADEIVEAETAEYVALGILMCYYVIWLLADVCGFGRVTSHILTPYMTYVLAFVMVLYKNWGEGEDFNTLFKVGLGLTCAGAFLILVKISTNLGRCCSSDEKSRDDDDFEGGAVQYQEPDYDYEKEHDTSQTGLVHY